MAQQVFILGGPPKVGKDTATLAIIEAIGGDDIAVLKFTEVVKEAAHDRFGLFGVSAHHYESLKDVPLAEFGGLTPRAAYIETSRLLQAAHGPDIVARSLVLKLQTTHASTVIINDTGNLMEAEHIVNFSGAENCSLIRVSRDGHTFDGDCREHIPDLPGVECYDVHNAAMPAFANSIIDIVKCRLAEVELSQSVPAPTL